MFVNAELIKFYIKLVTEKILLNTNNFFLSK